MPLLFKHSKKISFIMNLKGGNNMYYARWCKDNEMKETLTEINLKKEVKATGNPIMYDKNSLYIPNQDAHTLVIGATGSGKTQATILPLTKLSYLAGESVVINDVKGDIYKRTAYNFQERGYQVIALNFDNPNLGSSWNPLTLAYQFYKQKNTDKAITLIGDLGYYLFSDTDNRELDPFWTNSTIDYFTGLTMYLFEHAKEEEINLNSIYNLANDLSDEQTSTKFLQQLDKTSTIYYNLSGTLKAPMETKGGIIATFNQKIKKYIELNNLSNMLSTSDFDIKEISNQKTAIFIISGLNTYSNSLIPLLVSQVITATDEFGKQEKRLNILLDEFDSMLPIKNFAKVINYARSIKIRFTVVIKSYIDLTNMYGKEQTEVIKSCFPILIYLLSNDIYTLEEISKMCGNHEIDKKVRPLISVEELKVMKAFEAIVLIPRMMPYKTTLLPDYKIDWNLEQQEMTIPPRKENHIKIYQLNSEKN